MRDSTRIRVRRHTGRHPPVGPLEVSRAERQRAESGRASGGIRPCEQRCVSPVGVQTVGAGAWRTGAGPLFLRTVRAGGLVWALAFAPLFCATASGDGYSFTEPWRWSRFTTENGLPSNRINEIVEARDGTTWVSTLSGPAWFDGYHWHAMGLIDGAPCKAAERITVDEISGILAVADGKAYRGDRNGFRMIPIPLANTSFRVRGVVPFQDGALIVLVRYDRTRQDALFKIDGGNATRINAPKGPRNSEIHSIWTTSGSDRWLHTSGGLYRWDDGSWQLHLPVEGGRRVISHLRVSNGEGWLWIGRRQLGRGIWNWNVGMQPQLVCETGRECLDALDVSPQGGVIAVQDSGTIRIWQDGRWSVLDRVPPELVGVRSIRFRSDGDLWVGTYHGLFLYDATGRLWHHWTPPSADSRNRVHEILEAHDGSVWIASSDGVETRLPDGQVKRMAEINGRNVRDSTGLAQDADGNLWVTSGSTFEGAFRFDGATWSYFGPEQGLRGYRHKARTDRQGRVWFLGLETALSGNATGGTGAAVYADGAFEHWTTADGLIHDRVFAFAEGLQGERWFGTLAGLSRWTVGRWTHWTPANGLAEPRIWTLAVDEDNTVWFADEWNGLGTIDQGVPRYLTTEDGLISNDVQDIRADPCGGIWISCMGGVTRLKNGRCYNIHADRGIGHSSLWPILPTRDRVFVGTLGAGTAVLDRARLESCTPRVALADPLVKTGSVTLRWHAAARDALIQPDEIEARFRLGKGEWSEWSVGRSTVFQVAPGAHTFTVQARSQLAESPTAENHLSFTVPYPIYRHPVVLSLGLAAVLVIASLTAIGIVRQGRHHAALRGSEEKFELAVRGSTDGLWDWQAVHGDKAWWSPRYFELLGYADGEIEADFADLEERLHPEDREATLEAVRAHLEDRVPYDVEYRLRTKSGEYRWFRSRGQALWDDSDRPYRMAGSLQDITDRKDAEEELRQARAELEKRVEDRTLELTKANRKLRAEIIERKQAEDELAEYRAHLEELVEKRTRELEASREQLRRSERLASIGTLAAGIAHEINNPVGGILLAAENALRLEGRADAADLRVSCLKDIVDNAKRCGQITKSVLRFAKEERTEKRPSDLNAIIRRAVLLTRRYAEDHGCTTELQLAEDLPQIPASPVEIEQVFINLIQNAAESGLGPVRILVSTERTRGSVRAVVKDNGRGVSEEHLRQVFDPFFTTRREQGGSGLGLSIVHGIMTEHGGTIDIESRPGRGTTCTLELPLAGATKTERDNVEDTHC